MSNGKTTSEEQRATSKTEPRLTFLLNSLIATFTIAGVAFSAYIYFHDLRYKEIRVALLESTPFFQNKIDFARSMSVNVGDRRVENLWYAKLRYENSGRTPVRKDEIESKSRITFSDAEVISASVSEKKPSNLDITANKLSDSLELIHGLLNPSDYVVFDVLLATTKSPTVTCSYRISDIKDCLFVNASQSPKEAYLVGAKINENIASFLILAANAFLMIFFLFVLVTIVRAVVGLVRYLRWRYEAKSLEEVITKLYGSETVPLVRETKIKDIAARWLSDEAKENSLKFRIW
jgi:hypothetical protein